MPKISIILPSYNHGKFLKDRLDSIVNQTYKDWELIIIEDKSSDNSLEILSDFLEKNKQKVKHFIVNEKNSGSGYFSWQKGIELAETEYIWIAETDDYSDEEFLDEEIKILDQNENCALSFSATNYVDTQKNFLYTSENRTRNLEVKENEHKVFDGKVYIDKIPFNTYITNGSSVVFRKPKFKIPDDIFNNRQCSDIFLWTFLLQNSSFIFLNKKLNYFRRHEGSTSTHFQTHKLETIYHENAEFLNYFNQTEKYPIFIDHYIKHYVWNNKKDFLNTSSIKKIKSNKNLSFIYFYKLVQFVHFKLIKK